MTGLPPRYRIAPGQPEPDHPIRSEEELVAFFAAGTKTQDERVLGVEYERVPLRCDGTAAPYAGDGSAVRKLLEHLGRAHELAPLIVDGHLVGLLGHDREIHLEPGAQVELVLAPKRTAAEVSEALTEWWGWLEEAAEATGVHAVGLGLQPITPVADVGWIPKERYAIMARHLGARGALAHHMMKATAALQLNVDFTSEPDAAELVRVALAVSPLVNAFTLNAPLEGGRRNGWLSKRAEIWRQTDPARCGLLPWVFEEGFTFARYVDWALSVPVMFLVREDRWHAVGDRTFRELMERGHATHGPARHADFHLHLTTLFPEVRVKQYVEIRGMDSCPAGIAAGVVALWRGILYDGSSRRRALDLVDGLTSSARSALHFDVAREGLAATARGVPVRDLCRELIAAASSGLEHLARPGGQATDASLLQPLSQVVDSGMTPAELLLADWDGGGRTAILSLA